MTRASPRIRRLRSDFRALQQLRADSTILDFAVDGDPPEAYTLVFHGQGVWRAEGMSEPIIRHRHEVSVKLGASYPRMMPELLWKSPIFHPNISASGVVCLGGYGTYWTPGLNLDELCTMLWEMIRFQNYDVESPYNREAAHWAKIQTQFEFPLDPRPIRDRVAGHAKPPGEKPPVLRSPESSSSPFVGAIGSPFGGALGGASTGELDVAEVTFLDTDNVVEAEIVDAEVANGSHPPVDSGVESGVDPNIDSGILYID